MIKRIIYKQGLRQERDAFGAWVRRLRGYSASTSAL